MIQNIDISDTKQRNDVLNYTQQLNDMNAEIIITEVFEWITQYEIWLQNEHNTSMDDLSVDNHKFYSLLRNEFLNEYKIYNDTIIFEENIQDNTTSIFSTKFQRFSYALTPLIDYYDMEDVYKDIAENND